MENVPSHADFTTSLLSHLIATSRNGNLVSAEITIPRRWAAKDKLNKLSSKNKMKYRLYMSITLFICPYLQCKCNYYFYIRLLIKAN